ncbi:polysaccharide lyase 8 family protein [Paraflavisolibacter sp. H34]|uniref:polysaccharide lyase 8 family protein n=1 Tax=Huijunlia imazamoxiresistens TaxID=3127457 RepID=UPI00301AF5FE
MKPGRRKQQWWLAAVCSLGALLPLAAGAQAYPYDTLMNRVRRQVLLSPAAGDSRVDGWLYSQQPDGSWTDVAYGDSSGVNWKPAEHLARLRVLAAHYLAGTGNGARQQELHAAIAKGLACWFQKDPQSHNWWHNEIATPQALGELLIQLRGGRQPLPAGLQDSLLRRMNRGDMRKQTGANKTDVALHCFYRALLTENNVLLKEAVDQLFSVIGIHYQKEGIQPDDSYLQHGPQLHISSYGGVFLDGVLPMANYVKGTPYALDAPKLELLSRYYRETYLRTIRGGYIDFNVEGRGISRKGILHKKGEKARLELMAALDRTHARDWKAAALRTGGATLPGYKIQPYHRHFWCGDYTLHQRPAYSFNIRLASTRTRRTEAGNDENLLGRYLSDGSTNIQGRGGEYFNILPVWEWDKVPGITMRDYAADRPTGTAWGEPGSTAFAGGVSDGVYGATGFELDHDSVTAKKAWFLFDKEVVCLGAGISSPAPEPITTTVNQCWRNGEVATSAAFGGLIKGASWVLHDGTGYYFPQGGQLRLTTGSQEGSWQRINRAQPKETVKGDVFKLWLDHGARPANADYAYIVLPGISSARKLRAFDASLLQVLANTPGVQAVYHQQLDMLQAVFYRPGSVRTPTLEVTVDKPCVLLVKNTRSGERSLQVADPTQREASVKITVKDNRSGSDESRDVALPQNGLAGSSASWPAGPGPAAP